jgi:hypothetical protein
MRVIVTSRHNEQNLGDRATSPANYFPWLSKAERIDLWDTDLRSILVPNDPTLVIVGGLGVFGWGTGLGFDRSTRTVTFDSNVEALADLQVANVVLWGVGHESRHLTSISYPEYLGKFRLVGLRDYSDGTNIAVPPKYEWVGCPSCLHPVFNHLDRYKRKTTEVIIYDHRDHRVEINDPGIPRMDHYASTMEEVIAWLGSAETVLTTSYHGALWATFLGAKVIIPHPWATKLLLYKHQPIVIESAHDWKHARRKAKVFPESLSECRTATEIFGKKVLDIYHTLMEKEKFLMKEPK